MIEPGETVAARHRRLVRIACAVAVSLMVGTAAAAEPDVPAVRLTPRPALLPGVAALPEVELADAAVAKRINDRLRRVDARVRAAALECRQADHGIPFTRKVTTTMRGPRFVSLLAEDAWNCAAYPDESRTALVYDLETGAPIDWARFLPPALAAKSVFDHSFVGLRLGLVESPQIAALWARRLKNRECGHWVETGARPSFQLWPDARAGGLSILIMTVPHVGAVCRETVTVPTAILRQRGVSAALLDAVDAAHRQGLFGP